MICAFPTVCFFWRTGGIRNWRAQLKGTPVNQQSDRFPLIS